MIKKTKFKIEMIDLEQGLCTVRHINPYGPVSSEEINEDEAKLKDNPNHDIITTFSIPLQSYEFISPDSLIEYISKNYPTSFFEEYLIVKLANKRDDLLSLIGQTYEKDIEVADELNVGTIMMTQYIESSGLEISTL